MSLETYAAIKMDFVIESEKEKLLEKEKVLSKSLSWNTISCGKG